MHWRLAPDRLLMNCPDGHARHAPSECQTLERANDIVDMLLWDEAGELRRRRNPLDVVHDDCRMEALALNHHHLVDRFR